MRFISNGMTSTACTTHKEVDSGSWWRDAVIYQIYPRSFADSDGDGVGDLAGISAHLDYLNNGAASSLGVDAVWLSPFYPSPLADFGYDVADYLDVDPTLGTLAEFDQLVHDAQTRGIRILVDLVVNHTSTEHQWFRESRLSRESAKRHWYIWAPPSADGGLPNNWLSAFRSVGNAWSIDDATKDYYLHSFTPGQADLNWRSTEVRAAIADVMRFWLRRGVAGFRVDVAHRLIKDEYLLGNPDELAHEHRHVSHSVLRQTNMDHPDVHEVIQGLRGVLDEFSDRVSLGEVPIHDPQRLTRYLGTNNDGLHMVFNFALWDAPWDAGVFRRLVDSLEQELPPWGWPCYALSNHDISRVASRYGGDGQAKARVAAMFLLTVRGTPCLYYGEELGMTNGYVIPSRLARDVDGRDAYRTPMQWSSTADGFTTGSPWLPPNLDASCVNVATQRRDPRSVFNLYRRLISFRKKSFALRRGIYEPIDTVPNVFAYRRASGADNLLVALNFGAEACRVRHKGLYGGAKVELSTALRIFPDALQLGTMRLEPHEGVIIRLSGE
jgi:alpha-glucosidase